MANEAKFEYDLLNLWESVFHQNFSESNNFFGLTYRWSLIDFFQLLSKKYKLMKYRWSFKTYWA